MTHWRVTAELAGEMKNEEETKSAQACLRECGGMMEIESDGDGSEGKSGIVVMVELFPFSSQVKNPGSVFCPKEVSAARAITMRV